MAGWVALTGSALLVLTLFDSMGQIRSIEMRDSINEFLATSPGAGLGLDRAEILNILRGTMFFAGAAGAAATVLAIYVLQGNQGARIGFTIAAVAIILTAPVTGSPFAVLVAVAAAMLWTRPARDWFAGRPAASARKEGRGIFGSSEQPRPGANQSGGNGPSTGGSGSPEWQRPPDSPSDRPVPPPTQGFGAPTASNAPSYPEQGQPQQQSQQQPQQQPQQGAQQQPQPQSGYGAQGQAPYGQGQQGGQQGQSWQPSAYGQQPQQYGGYPPYRQAPNPDKRPTTVTVAVWLTWVLAGLTAVVFGFVMLAMLAAKDQLIEGIQAEPEFQQLGVSSDDLIALLWVTCAIVLFWCASAIVLASFAYRRQNWARIALAASSAVTVLFSIAGITSVVSLVTLIGAGAVIVLLFTGGANQWYSSGRSGGYPSYPQEYTQQPGQGYGQPQGQAQGQAQGQPYAGSPGQPPYGQQGQQGQQPPVYGEPDQGSRPTQGQPESGDKQDPPKNVW